MDKLASQCLLIADKAEDYAELAQRVNAFGDHTSFNVIPPKKSLIVKAIKKLQGVSVIFIPEESEFSVSLLSDLVWQLFPDAIIVVLTTSYGTTAINQTLDNTSVSYLSLDNDDQATRLHLDYIMSMAKQRYDFRQCKHLLGLSEKRQRWLVDASKEAIAYITRDIHLYANQAYLALFDLKSLEKLHAIPVSDLFENDEYKIFEHYISSQLHEKKIGRSLIITISRHRVTSRARIVAVPSVFEGRKCFQLWVQLLAEDEYLSDDREKLMKSEFSKGSTNNISHIRGDSIRERKRSSFSILKDIIRQKEASIGVHKLTPLKLNEGKYDSDFDVYYVSFLKVSTTRKKAINELLFKPRSLSAHDKKAIFWDQVKVARLIQTLLKKKVDQLNIMMRLSDAAVKNTHFLKWLIEGLSTIKGKASHITFLISSQGDEMSRKQTIVFINHIKAQGCHVGLDDFTVSKESLTLLKIVKPNYVRLSLPWVKKIEGNKKREIALGSLIRQLESKNIRVIAPCGFSLEMRKVFTLSGASFCQEKQ